MTVMDKPGRPAECYPVPALARSFMPSRGRSGQRAGWKRALLCPSYIPVTPSKPFYFNFRKRALLCLSYIPVTRSKPVSKYSANVSKILRNFEEKKSWKMFSPWTVLTRKTAYWRLSSAFETPQIQFEIVTIHTSPTLNTTSLTIALRDQANYF
jgi:hypothetical protein